MTLETAETAAPATHEDGDGFTSFDLPTTWGQKFTEEDQAGVVQIINWLNARKKTQAHLARLSRANVGTLNQILRATYTSAPGTHIQKLLQVIKVQDDRKSKSSVPFLEDTSTYKLVLAAAHRARVYKNFAVIIGYVGTGKTASLKQVADSQANTYLVEANPDMGPAALLQALVTLTKAEVVAKNKYSKGTAADMLDGLLKALEGTNSLIIVDEAETMAPRSLHYLRRLRDKAGIGVLLAGTLELARIIKPDHGQFDQIRSRVGYWPETITSITRDDADKIAAVAFPDHDIDTAVLDALWAFCQGSARVLVEDLIPAIRDYGLAKGRKLDDKLVKQVATQALRLKPRKEGA